jgi:hypothetical protein
MKSLTRLESKLAAMERVIPRRSGNGPCRCQHPQIGAVLWPGDTLKDTDDIPCGVCGGALPVIAVRYDDPIHEEE